MATSSSYHQVSLIANKRIRPWVGNLEYKRILLEGIMGRLEAQKWAPPVLTKVESLLQWPPHHFCGLTQFSVSPSGWVAAVVVVAGLFAPPSPSGAQAPSILWLLSTLSPWDSLHSTAERMEPLMKPGEDLYETSVTSQVGNGTCGFHSHPTSRN